MNIGNLPPQGLFDYLDFAIDQVDTEYDTWLDQIDVWDNWVEALDNDLEWQETWSKE